MQDFREFVLLDFGGVRALRGQTVLEATLRLQLDARSQGELSIVDVSTIASDWVQGASHKGSPASPGESTYNWKHAPGPNGTSPRGVNWAYPGSTFGDVAWTNGGSLFDYVHHDRVRHENTSSGRWVSIELSTSVVNGLILDQGGLVLTDPSQMNGDPGWSLPFGVNSSLDIRFERSATNPGYLDSGLASASTYDGAVLVVKYADSADESAAPPPAVDSLHASTVGLWNGQVEVTWENLGANGSAFGYDVAFHDATAADASATCCVAALTAGALPSVNTTQAPRYSIPRPGAPGSVQRMWLENLPHTQHGCVTVRAYDHVGTNGSWACSEVSVPMPRKDEQLAMSGYTPFSPSSAHRFGDALAVVVADEYTKLDPISGQPQHGTAVGNSIWDGKQAVTLSAARGEMVALQLFVSAARPGAVVTGVRPVLAQQFNGSASGVIASFFREWYAVDADPTSKTNGTYFSSALLPMVVDACDCCAAAFDVPTADWGVNLKPKRQTTQGVWVDLWVPEATTAGVYTSEIHVFTASSSSADVIIEVTLTVLPFALPREQSFRLDLNGYGYHATFGANTSCGWNTSMPECMLRHHQLTHAHRMTTDIVEYSHCQPTQPGTLYTCPQTAGRGAATKVADWSAFDGLLGPLFDGTAFTPAHGYNNAPGAGTPIATFMLSFYEDYPLNLTAHYSPLAMWAEFFTNRSNWNKNFKVPSQAISQEYAEATRAVVADHVHHYANKSWTGTHFQFFLNNKYAT